MNQRGWFVLCLLLTVSVPCWAQNEVQSETTVQEAGDAATKARASEPTKEAAPKKERKWVYTIAPYLLTPFVSGELGLSDFTSEIDADPGDVFGALDWGIMLWFEATHPKWAAIGDFVYIDLGRSVQSSVGRGTEVDTDLDVKMLIAEFYGFRRLANWVELGLGLRLVHQRVNVDVELESNLPVPPELAGGEHWTWVDPLIAARFRVPFENNWRLGVLGDFGGFYVGSNYSWQARVYGGYLFCRVFELAVAFRAIGMKYVDGSGSDRYLFDAIIWGPEIGLVFHI